MNIAFRVDASAQIGTGHFMRCLTLADELKQGDAQIRFICRHLPGYMCKILEVKGYQLVLLDSAQINSAVDELAHSHWLGVSQAQDSADTELALSDEAWDWLIVDHYALDVLWEQALRDTAKKIMVIDDIADRQHDCDVLLDQNFYTDVNIRYSGTVPPHCQLLLGPRYALLRNEFRQLHDQIKLRNGLVERLLVFFGGADTNNYTGHTIKVLANLEINDLHVDVVIGELHPCREKIETECKKHGFTCHVQTSQMAELMAAADMAIGSGGSAIWERCCLGLPSITICAADNQRQQIEDAASVGLLYAPDKEKEGVGTIECHLSSLIENRCLRRLLSHKGMQAVDGRGALRVSDRIGCSGIEIRNATLTDSDRLFEWRNHPAIRAVSLNPDTITRGEHDQWFTSVLGDVNRILLIGQRNQVPIGVVRFDIHDCAAEVSIYLAPDSQNSGLGKGLLRCSELLFAQNYPKVNELHANVLGQNERSQLLFQAAGYQVKSTTYSKGLYQDE